MVRFVAQPQAEELGGDPIAGDRRDVDGGEEAADDDEVQSTGQVDLGRESVALPRGEEEEPQPGMREAGQDVERGWPGGIGPDGDDRDARAGPDDRGEQRHLGEANVGTAELHPRPARAAGAEHTRWLDRLRHEPVLRETIEHRLALAVEHKIVMGWEEQSRGCGGREPARRVGSVYGSRDGRRFICSGSEPEVSNVVHGRSPFRLPVREQVEDTRRIPEDAAPAHTQRCSKFGQ